MLLDHWHPTERYTENFVQLIAKFDLIYYYMEPFTIIQTTFYKEKTNVNVNELSNYSIPIDFWCLSNNYTCFEITLHTLTS